MTKPSQRVCKAVIVPTTTRTVVVLGQSNTSKGIVLY